MQHVSTGIPGGGEEVREGTMAEAEAPAMALPTPARPGNGRDLTIADMFGLAVKTIVIDAGHGGQDPGAIGQGGTKEKDITLDVAQRLKSRLEQYGTYRILLTRGEDVRLSLKERVAFANAHTADLFISIHVNYLAAGPFTAIETYYFGLQSDQQTLSLVERENSDSEYHLGDFKALLEKAGNTLKLQESKALAAAVQQSLYRNVSRQNTRVSDSGIKTAPFVVLLETGMPSILVEIACLNNRKEETRLGTSAYRDTLARYLEEGILHYLHERFSTVASHGGSTTYVIGKGERRE
jgi:N-acetylmuramoyl-L-alanine amidase